MHVELPKVRLESLKDFAKHYLMIVLSILTALGLEAWIEHAHHEQAARVASTQIETEIRANLVGIDRSLAEDERQARLLVGMRDALVQDVATHATQEAMKRHIQALVKPDELFLNLRWPTLRQEAWDLAVANQSAGWIDDARLRRYAAAYASQRESFGRVSANLQLMLDGPRMIDTLTDLRTGEVQPREFLHVLSQMALMLDQARSSLAELHKQLEAALPGERAPGA